MIYDYGIRVSFYFFKQKTAYEMRISDWSSDVCSSDLYTTLLSIVPLLALAFSVLKALGAHNAIEPFLREFLAPLGPQAGELTEKLVGFIEKIQVGVLGSLGVALLFWSAISLIQKVESSFNFVWRIERPRPLQIGRAHV